MDHSPPLDAPQAPETDAPTLDPADVAIGLRVAAARERRAMSRVLLAGLAGVNPVTVGRVEDGHPTTVGTLRAFAAALGVTLGDLVGGE